MCTDLVIGPAEQEDLVTAFRLQFQYLPAQEAEVQVGRALRLVHTGELEREGVLVAQAKQGVVGTIVTAALAGRSALVWPPQVSRFADQVTVEDGLLGRALQWLQHRSARVVQALLPPADSQRADSLLRHGFQRMTRLQTLVHPLYAWTPADDYPDPDTLLQWHYYDPLAPDLFHRTLQRSYEGTLDCPELNGVRTIDEVIAGQKSHGEHDPARWLLALEDGFPVGVLMLTAFPEWHEWDLSYVGLVPEARGRGLGTLLVCKALEMARTAGTGQLTLAVDERNQRAWRIYAGLGFALLDEREVFWRVLE